MVVTGVTRACSLFSEAVRRYNGYNNTYKHFPIRKALMY